VASATTGITVIQITDTHLGVEPGPIRPGQPDSDAQLAAVLEQLQRRHPTADLVLVTGDLVEVPEPPAYQRLVRQLSGLPAPLVALAGNHDDRTLAHQVFTHAGHGFDGERVIGPWLILGVDSSYPDHSAGWVSAAELQRIEDSIARHPAHWVLVAVHHPVVAIGSEWMDAIGLLNGEEFLARLTPHARVRACVFGHIHQTFDQTHGGLRLLGCPATCVQFRPGSKDFALDPEEAGYRVLHLHPDGRLETRIERVADTRTVVRPS